MSNWTKIRCACGTTNHVSPLLAGGPIPCADCGRVCRPARSTATQTKSKGTRRSGTRSAPRPRADRFAAVPAARRAIRKRKDPRSYSMSLLVAAAVATVVAYGLILMGEDPYPPFIHVAASLIAMVIDVAIVATGAAVLGLGVGTLAETCIKIVLMSQIFTALVAGAALMGGGFLVASLLLLVTIFLGPSLFVRLFDWNWGEAILVFVAQMLCHLAISTHLDVIAAAVGI